MKNYKIYQRLCLYGGIKGNELIDYFDNDILGCYMNYIKRDVTPCNYIYARRQCQVTNDDVWMFEGLPLRNTKVKFVNILEFNIHDPKFPLLKFRKLCGRVSHYPVKDELSTNQGHFKFWFDELQGVWMRIVTCGVKKVYYLEIALF